MVAEGVAEGGCGVLWSWWVGGWDSGVGGVRDWWYWVGY